MQLRTQKVKATGTMQIWDRKIGEKEFRLVHEENNLVVTAGLNLIRARLFTSSSSAYIQYGAAGSGSTTPTGTDTDLESVIGSRVALTDVNTVTDGEVTVEWSYGFSDGNGSHSEAGLFTAASSGTMLCRATFSAKTKDSTIERIYRWRIVFTGAT